MSTIVLKSFKYAELLTYDCYRVIINVDDWMLFHNLSLCCIAIMAYYIGAIMAYYIG